MPILTKPALPSPPADDEGPSASSQAMGRSPPLMGSRGSSSSVGASGNRCVYRAPAQDSDEEEGGLGAEASSGVVGDVFQGSAGVGAGGFSSASPRKGPLAGTDPSLENTTSSSSSQSRYPNPAPPPPVDTSSVCEVGPEMRRVQREQRELVTTIQVIGGAAVLNSALSQDSLQQS